MILLDTNVVSEPLRKAPQSRVIAWIDAQPTETLYLSAVTVAELRFGVASLPKGRRRNALSESLERQALQPFSGRILPFDLSASQFYAELLVKAKSAGCTMSKADAYIAAIAAAHDMSVATRDTTPFEAAGLVVINPWDL
jgi:hypothetical protein